MQELMKKIIISLAVLISSTIFAMELPDYEKTRKEEQPLDANMLWNNLVFKAIQDNDVDLLEGALAGGANINLCNKDGFAPLAYTIKLHGPTNPRIDIFDFLLKQEELNLKEWKHPSTGDNILDFAKRNSTAYIINKITEKAESLDILNLLCKNKKTSTTAQVKTRIILSANSSANPWIEKDGLFVKLGHGLVKKSFSKNFSLLPHVESAIAQSDEKQLKLLLGEQDINEVDNEIDNKVQEPLLIRTVKTNNLMIAELLINGGININKRNKLGWTALMQAAADGNKDMVNFLLEVGADTTVMTNGDLGAGGLNATELAYRNGHTELAVQLELKIALQKKAKKEKAFAQH